MMMMMIEKRQVATMLFLPCWNRQTMNVLFDVIITSLTAKWLTKLNQKLEFDGKVDFGTLNQINMQTLINSTIQI